MWEGGFQSNFFQFQSTIHKYYRMISSLIYPFQRWVTWFDSSIHCFGLNLKAVSVWVKGLRMTFNHKVTLWTFEIKKINRFEQISNCFDFTSAVWWELKRTVQFSQCVTFSRIAGTIFCRKFVYLNRLFSRLFGWTVQI